MTYETRQMADLRARYLQEAVETATPAARLVMLLDKLEMDLLQADEAFATGSDLQSINQCLVSAQAILMTLHDTLDAGAWADGDRLKGLYGYLHSELVQANLEKDRERAARAAELVRPVAAAWRQAVGSLQPAAIAG